jgi:hypothetical protein
VVIRITTDHDSVRAWWTCELLHSLTELHHLLAKFTECIFQTMVLLHLGAEFLGKRFPA